MNLLSAVRHLSSGGHFSEVQSTQLLSELVENDPDPAVVGAVLMALRLKAETPEELRGFSSAMTALYRGLDEPHEAGSKRVDICGFGPRDSRSPGISIGVGLLSVACGLDVVSQAGLSYMSGTVSEHFLARLGLSLSNDTVQAGIQLQRAGFCLFPAGSFHPAMEQIFSISRSLDITGVFDVAQALSNPGRPRYLSIGADSPKRARLIAEALVQTDVCRAFVMHGSDGWGTATSVGPFRLWDVCSGRISESEREPADWGFPQCVSEDLIEGDAFVQADRLAAVFRCRDSGPYRDTLVLGTGLVLELCGIVHEIQEGIVLARQALDDGRAFGVLEQLRTPDVT